VGAVAGEDQGKQSTLLRRLTGTVASGSTCRRLVRPTDELVIVEWYKHEGDTVALGESLLSVQTDKAQVDVESVVAGRCSKSFAMREKACEGGSPVAYNRRSG